MQTVRDMLKRELKSAWAAKETGNWSAYAEFKERIRVLFRHRHNTSFDCNAARSAVKQPLSRDDRSVGNIAAYRASNVVAMLPA